MKVFVVDPNRQFAEALKTDLLSLLNISTLWKKNLKELEDSWSAATRVPLVLAKDQIDGNFTIPYVQSRTHFSEHPIRIISYSENDSVFTIVQAVAKYLKIELPEKDQQKYRTDQYVKIPSQVLGYAKRIPSSLGLKLGKNDHSAKILNIANPLDDLSDKLEQYRGKNIREFYIPRKDLAPTLTAIANQVLIDSEKKKTRSTTNLKACARLHLISNIILNELGATNPAVDLVNQQVESVYEELVHASALAPLIKEILASPGDHRFQASFLTGVVCHHLLRTIGLTDPLAVQHLIYASILCDFRQRDPLLFYVIDQSMLDHKRAEREISQDEYSFLYRHAFENAEFFGQNNRIPTRVVTLIREHHGSPLGFGLNRRDAREIDDLSRYLFVAGTFTKMFLSAEYGHDKRTVLRHLKQSLDHEESLEIADLLRFKID